MVLACGQPDPHLNPMLPDDIETTIKLFEDMVDWLATSVSINEGKTPNLQLQPLAVDCIVFSNVLVATDYRPTVLGDFPSSIKSDRILSVSRFPGSLSARLVESSSSSATSTGLSVDREDLAFANFAGSCFCSTNFSCGLSTSARGNS